MNILLMGPQGAGKGTVADILKTALEIPHISMGDLLRETLEMKSPLSEEIQSYMNQGVLVPLHVIQKMLQERLEMPDCEAGFILDGFPRDKQQSDVLKKIVQIQCLILLEVSREVSLFRLGNRVQCHDCGHIFNLKTCPPKEENVCDICGGDLYQRTDDKPEAIAKRLDIYESETKPLIEEYKDVVVRFDSSEDSPAVIAEKILQYLKTQN